jgi:hypothetical protein
MSGEKKRLGFESAHFVFNVFFQQKRPCSWTLIPKSHDFLPLWPPTFFFHVFCFPSTYNSYKIRHLQSTGPGIHPCYLTRVIKLSLLPVVLSPVLWPKKLCTSSVWATKISTAKENIRDSKSTWIFKINAQLCIYKYNTALTSQGQVSSTLTHVSVPILCGMWTYFT